MGSIQAIYRCLHGDLRKVVFTPMKIRSLLNTAFNYKTRTNFTDRISDLGLKKRAELAKEKPAGEYIPAADYRLQDEDYVREFMDFLESTVHRLGSYSNFTRKPEAVPKKTPLLLLITNNKVPTPPPPCA